MKILLAMILTIVWLISTAMSGGAGGEAFNRNKKDTEQFKSDAKAWLFFTFMQSASMFICGFLACGFLQ